MNLILSNTVLAIWSKIILLYINKILRVTFSSGESFLPEKDNKKDGEYELKRMENGEAHGEASPSSAMMQDDDDDDEIYEPPVRALAS